MMTLKQFATGVEAIPAAISWSLADLGEARGKQDSVTVSSAKVLRVLQEQTLMESAVSSSRLDGVEIPQECIGRVMCGSSPLKNRNEEAIRGYCNALELIHQYATMNPVSEELIQLFHRICSGEILAVDQYIIKDGNIISKYPGSQRRIRYKKVSVAQPPESLLQLIQLWRNCIQERWVHPLIALAGFNLDYICVCSLQNANGRVSRLLLLLQLYQLGYEAGRYISIERLMEQNKERFYETLELSSRGWHEGQHDPWPYINYVLFILRAAYKELEECMDQTALLRGEKSDGVVQAIRRQAGSFRIADIRRISPGVGYERIRQILVAMKVRQEVDIEGHGSTACYRYLGNTNSDSLLIRREQ
ncbi:MAG: hypothetical protein FWD64_00515 [Acidobacteriaceae bacterium]|nr:hypothetical protein [Acidobacteriaceae bacterium]